MTLAAAMLWRSRIFLRSIRLCHARDGEEYLFFSSLPKNGLTK